MAGLLDFLTSDDAQLGLGLLAAGGPSTVPMNLGQRISMGVGQAQAAKDARMRQKLLESQVAENAAQAAREQQKIELAKRQMELDAAFMGGEPGAAPSGGAGAAGGGAPQPLPAPGAAPVGGGGFTAAQIAKQFGIPIEAVIADYKFNGGKKIAELIDSRAKPDWQTANGFTFNRNAPGFAGGFMPSMTTSNDGKSSLSLPGPDGLPRVYAPQGAVDTFRQYADTGNRSSAQYTPGRPVIMDGGRMGGQSQLQEIGGGGTPVPLIGPGAGVGGGGPVGNGGGPANGQPIPNPMRPRPTDTDQNYIFNHEFRNLQAQLADAQSKGDAAGVARQQALLREFVQEAQRSGVQLQAPAATPAPLIGPGAGVQGAGAGRGTQGVPMAPAAAPAGVPGGGVAFSPTEDAAAAAAQAAQVTAATEAAKNAAANVQAPIKLRQEVESKQALGDVVPTAERKTKIAAADTAINLIDEALAAPGRATATGLSGKLDPRNYVPGTDAYDFQARLKQLGGTAFLSAYQSMKGTGPVSEAEGLKAESAVARLQTAQSDKAFETALKDYRSSLQKMRAEAAGETASGGGGKALDTLPPAQAHKGRTVRDTATGKLLYSDGLSWQPKKD